MSDPREPRAADLVGRTVGNYEVTGKIGEGGMGAVYLARHPLIGRRAAIKVLLPEYGQRRDLVDRFFNEARACAALKHPGIVEIYDFGKLDDGSAYIVMEYLEGEPLSRRLGRLRRFAPGDALAVGHQMARALGAAHARGIVHRDLKPDNVYVVRDSEDGSLERVKLLDFGIAKLNEDGVSSGKTRTGAILGTPAYMSPEQCEGAGNVDHRGDIYSLGVILYELLSGRVPFTGDGFGKILAAHLHVQPPPLRQHAPDVPAAVEELVMSLLAKDRARRPQTCAEVAAAIESLAVSLKLPARPGEPGGGPSTFRTPAPSDTGAPFFTPTPAPHFVPTPAPRGPGGTPAPAPAAHTTLSDSATTVQPSLYPSASGAPRRGAGVVVAVVLGLLLVAGAGAAGVVLLRPEDDSAGVEDDEPDDGDSRDRPRAANAEADERDEDRKKGARDDAKGDDAKGDGAKGDGAKGDGAKGDGDAKTSEPATTGEPAGPATAAAPSVVTHELGSTPSRARVYRLPDEKLVGETPCKLLIESGPGEITYVLRLANHEEGRATLPAGEPGSATVALKKMKKKPTTGGHGDASGMGLEIPR